MRRRELIAFLGAAIAWPLAARAQQPSGKVWRVAVLYPGSWENASDQAPFDSFREELQKLGYIDGKNIVIDRRGAYGHSERIPSLAEELLALRPDVFVAISPAAAVAAHRATSIVPIVMWGVGEPMALGLVDSLAHPGGNVTGTSTMSDKSCAKSVEILHAAFPAAKRIGVLMSSNPSHPRLFGLVKTAAGVLSLTVIPVTAPTPNDLKQAFADMLEKGCDALLVLIDVVRPEFHRWRPNQIFQPFISRALSPVRALSCAMAQARSRLVEEQHIMSIGSSKGRVRPIFQLNNPSYLNSR